MDRQRFIQYSVAIGAAITTISTKIFGSTSGCSITDSDVEGPFHRSGAPSRSNLAEGFDGTGHRLRVRGRVLGPDCFTPVAGAQIDLWHAGPAGEYDLDSSKFLFRGIITTDNSGAYVFDTLIPAGYRDGPLDRPAHIHYIIKAVGYKSVTTQLYFQGDPKLAGDIFVKQNHGLKRAMAYPKDDAGIHHINFDITLARTEK